MTKSKVILFLLLFGVTGKVLSQSEEVTTIHLKEFSVYFLPDSCNCEMLIDLHPKGKLQINLSDCMGRMAFKVFNEKQELISSGSYKNSLDTLKKYSIARSAIDGSRRVSVLSYFEPLADGVWSYYRKGARIRSTMYQNGIEVKHDNPEQN